MDESCGKGRPARLVRCADAAAGVAVEVFAEQDQVLPVGIVGVPMFLTMAGAVAILVRQEEVHHAAGDVFRDLDKRLLLAAAGGILHLEGFTVDQVVALQRSDEQHVHGKPDGAAPVAVAAEHAAVALGGNVLYGELLSVQFGLERLVKMLA